MPLQTVWGRILVPRRFASAPIGGLLVLIHGRLVNARAKTKQLLCDKFRSEVARDVISGVDVEYVGMNVRIKFGDSRSNRFLDI